MTNITAVTPTRVCVVWQRFGPYHLARLEASAELFRPRGAEVTAIEVAGSGGEHPWKPDQSSGSEARKLFPHQALESLSRSQIVNSMLTILDEIDPDAIAVAGYVEAAAHAGLRWARDHGRVAVLMSDSRREDAVRIDLRERFKRLIVAQFDAALAAGTPQRQYVQELGIPAHRILVPYDVVDNCYFARHAAAARSDPARYSYLPGPEPGTRFFLAAGRFIRRKNFDNLIRAYHDYAAKPADSPPWDLVIVGDGPEQPRLRRLAGGDASGRITFAGYRNAEEMAAYYGLADVFIHPAMIDQWGLVVNEAMAAGLPVLVSSGVGAVEDLVVSGLNGFTFDPRDIRDIARAMRRIAASDMDREAMGRYARTRVAQWSPRHFAEGLWDAIVAGMAAPKQRLPLTARIALRAMQSAPPSLYSWYSVER